MSRFNTRGHQAKPLVATATSPIGTVSKKAADTRTFNGAPGWTKDPLTDLFLRCSSSFHDGSDKYYETGYQRDAKLRELSAYAAVHDFDWFSGFVKWLRRVANIRTAAIMAAADGVYARLDAGLQAPGNSVMPTNREVIASVLYRADEPGEMLAYWMHQYGRRIPQPVKRGIADAASELYTTRSLLKYDTGSHAVRFGDVLELCHAVPKDLVGVPRRFTDFSTGVPCPRPDKQRFPTTWIHPDLREKAPTLRSYLCVCGWYHLTSQKQAAKAPVERVAKRQFIGGDTWQRQLFKYAIDRRHGNDKEIPDKLSMIARNRELYASSDVNRWLDTETLSLAGMTWEDALSAVGGKTDKRKIWEAMAPNMGYMALIRNLRGMDEAGVSDEVAAQIAAKLADPQEVAKSRQLPFRFYSAVNSVSSFRWLQALETAFGHAVANVPELSGRTLVLTDSSGSMDNPMSAKSSVSCAEAAGVFAAAISQRNAGHVDLYEYADYPAAVSVPRGGSALKLAQELGRLALHHRCGYGTEIAASIRKTYAQHDRVIIFTDGQGSTGYSAGGVGACVPENVPVYLFNIQSYSASPMPTGGAARFDLGGLSDQTFKLIPLLEQGGRNGSLWPWEVSSS